MKLKSCERGGGARTVESRLLLLLTLAVPGLASSAQSGAAPARPTAPAATRTAAMRVGERAAMPAGLPVSTNVALPKLGVSSPATWGSAESKQPEAVSRVFPARVETAGTGADSHTNPASAEDLSRGGRRDPFRLPLPPVAAGVAGVLPRRPMMPGKHGLVISQLRLQGTVRGSARETAGAGSGASSNGASNPTEMIAVVTNASKIAYFLREHDLLYDGRVTQITAEAVWFEQEYLDPAGHMKSRDVVKRLNAASDEEP